MSDTKRTARITAEAQLHILPWVMGHRAVRSNSDFHYLGRQRLQGAQYTFDHTNTRLLQPRDHGIASNSGLTRMNDARLGARAALHSA